MTRKPRMVKSDQNMFSILESISNSDGITLTEISDETGLANSSVHSHLSTLEIFGLVSKDNKEYRLGLRFLEYGDIAQRQQKLYRVASDMIDQLANKTNEKVWCFIEENGQAVYLYGSQGDHSIKTYARQGQRTGLHHVAGGKSILAFLPSERVDEIIQQHGLPSVTENTITDRSDLFIELDKIRERGVAFNHEESVIGLHAIGAPIKHNGHIFGSISISGPANRLSVDRMETDLTDTLLGFTNEVEINLRYDNSSYLP